MRATAARVRTHSATISHEVQYGNNRLLLLSKGNALFVECVVRGGLRRMDAIIDVVIAIIDVIIIDHR